MFERLKQGVRSLKKGRILMAALAGIAALAALAVPTPTEAHCDSRNGPVVTAARKALATGNVNVILPYVKPADEAELTAVFKQTLAVRKLGGQARDIAEQHFFETAVRLHRVGEGAPYTGLTDEPTDPAIKAADQALATGSLKPVNAMLSRMISEGLNEQYNAVVAARQHAAKQKTVAAERERVEAELAFEKYVFALAQAAQGHAAHTEGAAPPHGAGQ
jgi:uncharacterized protein DUF6448